MKEELWLAAAWNNADWTAGTGIAGSWIMLFKHETI